jgi:hypothetical protein
VSNDDFAKKLAQHLLAAPESPFTKTFREIADSPLAQRMRALSESPVPESWRAFANNDIVKAAQFLNPSSSVFQAAMQTEEMKRLSERLEKFASAANSPEIQRFIKQISASQIAARKFVLPALDKVPQIATDISRIVGPYRTAALADDWPGRLAQAMGRLDQPWAIEGGVNVSATGFARMVRLSDAAHAAAPFSRPVSELFASELGGQQEGLEASAASRDAAAVADGLQADLIAFPPSNYGGIVFTAGFRFSVIGPPPPQAIEAADPDAAYDPGHATLLSTVERHLRHLVEEKLGGVAGSSWIKSRVSEAARRQWADRQEEDRQLGRPVYGLIHYADFMDLANVITQRNNWAEAFSAIFGNTDDLRVSLYRLHPVRKAIAHSRPLCRADVLTLVAEATRILKAIGIDPIS